MAGVLGSTVVSSYEGWPENSLEGLTMQVVAFKDAEYFTCGRCISHEDSVASLLFTHPLSQLYT